MAPGGGGLGVARAARARVKPLATQRFFARTLPALLAPLGSSSASAPLLGRANRAAYLRAFLHLARHAPRAALVQTVAMTLPVLAEAIESAAGFDRDRRGDEGVATGAKKPTGESAADPDALASGLALASAFLSDDRAREALAAHAERHAGALVSALCRVSVSVSRDGGLAMAAREDALDALAAAAERGSLPFAAVYPRRREATEAATRALDDPKRRVRRMAARCKEAWRELGEAR
jgi:DNA repair/transcription protein MET18/MMS19